MGVQPNRVVHSIVYGGDDRAVLFIDHPVRSDSLGYYYTGRLEHDHTFAGRDGDLRLNTNGIVDGLAELAPAGMADRLLLAVLEVMDEYAFLADGESYRELKALLGGQNMHG